MRRLFLLWAIPCILLTCASGEIPNDKPVTNNAPKEKENLDVFHRWIRWNNPGSLLMNHLISEADNYYKLRDEQISNLQTRQDWERRQAEVKKKLNDIVGPFPEKTPLNAKITGTLKKEGYRVEKIIYEAMPGYYVTGCLFIPDNIKGKAPAILNVIGHSQAAFRAELYQTIILNLAKKGMIVFAIDPPGQGERIQYFDPKINSSSIGYSVIEHCYFGNQCFLSGSSCAKYFIWEGIRAIDYLLSRKEVDAFRIGVTGLSGGGTITSYISAFDDRVGVSVPCSWATACKRQLETKGAQDAETEFYRGLAEGITFEDLIEVRAPKPTLMTFTSRDQYLSLQGAREALWEAQKAYRVFGKEENIELVEDDYIHWLTPKLRLAIYRFFMHHFQLSGDPAEEDVKLLSNEELQVSETGQISTSLNSKMIFDANRDETAKLLHNLEESRKNINHHLNTVLPKAKFISGYKAPSGEVIEPFINGRYQRDGYVVEKYAVRGEGYYAIPMLLFVPDNCTEKRPAVIYLHTKGKAVDAQPGGEIEKLVKKGYVVVAADVLGIGEIKDNSARGLATGYTGVLIGRSIPGIQAGDIVNVVNYLKSRPEVDADKIGAVGIGNISVSLLHAVAFDPSIKNVTLIDMPISYRLMVMNRFYKLGLPQHEGHLHEVDFTWGIAGVLTGYDLPDLLACIAPRKVTLVGLKDQMLEPVGEEVLKTDTRFPSGVYSSKNASGNFRIRDSYESLVPIIDWSFE
ncbi:MAG: alpha/beta hydrolase family protein [Prolixibacteraceae bacterium]|jgi:cephalosporin-C deacetylase-like acetyl esterase|nr:alpha/beta hydrolase family protein [Prolixibacteraceae bacterium]